MKAGYSLLDLNGGNIIKKKKETPSEAGSLCLYDLELGENA